MVTALLSINGLDFVTTAASSLKKRTKTDCSSCLNPSTEDQYFHNWKRHTTCGTNPVTYSITTISCTRCI